MVKSVSFVKDAFISRGSGILDFEAELREIMPNFFVVNADGHTAEKRDLCRSLGIQYIILERKPHPGLKRAPPPNCVSEILCLIELTWQAVGTTSPLFQNITRAQ